ncbi:MAG TPA: hypothetical protein VGE59_01690 [Patescibacteria group bacterium]
MTKPQLVSTGMIIIVLALGIGYATKKFAYARESKNRSAIMLTNGRTYIGYLSQRNNQYVTLDEAYYITPNSAPDTEPKKKLTLTKVSDEAYGPEERIYINRDTIVSIAPMRNESKVTSAITKYEQEHQASPSPSITPAETVPPAQ